MPNAIKGLVNKFISKASTIYSLILRIFLINVNIIPKKLKNISIRTDIKKAFK